MSSKSRNLWKPLTGYKVGDIIRVRYRRRGHTRDTLQYLRVLPDTKVKRK